VATDSSDVLIGWKSVV